MRSTRLPAQCLPGNRPARHAFVLRLQLHPNENRTARSFVAAGSGEAREGGPSYEGRIIRRGDQSPEAMREKARFVLGAMEQRMTALGFGWADVEHVCALRRSDGGAHTRRLIIIPDRASPENCPPGMKTGDAISPPGATSVAACSCRWT